MLWNGAFGWEVFLLRIQDEAQISARTPVVLTEVSPCPLFFIAMPG
jgi:hypothetical protein